MAGAPLANDIVSCNLKPVNARDYAVTFTPEEIAALVGPEVMVEITRRAGR